MPDGKLLKRRNNGNIPGGHVLNKEETLNYDNISKLFFFIPQAQLIRP
jgi:hypothetical protein